MALQSRTDVPASVPAVFIHTATGDEWTAISGEVAGRGVEPTRGIRTKSMRNYSVRQNTLSQFISKFTKLMIAVKMRQNLQILTWCFEN